MIRGFAIAALLLLAGCGGPPARAPAAWDGELEVHGSLRAMMHAGATGAAVRLDALVPDETLYAVGALAELAGEVTIVAGSVSLAYPDGDGTRDERVRETAAGAALLVAARVPAWVELTLDEPVELDGLGAAIARLAPRAGWSADDRFPFLIDGETRDLVWHVIDGTRLDGGGDSHEDHLAAAVTRRRAAGPARLVGFHSPRDQGVFTHAGSRTHVHCVVERPHASGHVDGVRIEAGAVVRFPLRAEVSR